MSPFPYRRVMHHANNSPTLSDHIHAEHENLRPHVQMLLTTAHAVGVVPTAVLRDMVKEVLEFLLRELEPHAQLEDGVLYGAVERALGAPQSADTMRRDHVEVSTYAQELSNLHGGLVSGHEPDDAMLRDLRRVLYGLHAVVRLHFSKEEEIYATIVSTRLSAAEQNLVLSDLLSHSGH